jgi:hypothetical protein
MRFAHVHRLGLAIILTAVLAGIHLPSRAFELKNDLWRIEIDPSTLEMKAHPAKGKALHLGLSIPELGEAKNLRREGNRADWELPEKGAAVSLHLDGADFYVTIRVKEPGSFSWPRMRAEAPVRALILPHWEGCYVPLDEPRWIDYLAVQGSWDTLEGLCMPFWGMDCGDYSLTYIATHRYNNDLRFEKDGDRLNLEFVHEFPPNHAPREYGFVIVLGGNDSPIEPALKYRERLIAEGKFVSMKEKMAKTPKAEWLLGAPQVYLWGDAYLAKENVRSPTSAWAKVWKPFCKQLIAESESERPSPGKRIRALMAPDAWDAVVEMVKEPYDSVYLQRNIASGLSTLMGLPEFFDAPSWEGIEIPDEAKRLLSRDRAALSPKDLARMNGLLLQSAYPAFLEPVDRWGGTVSVAMLKRLKEAGFERMLICLDGWAGVEKRPEVAAEADRMGYLFGTYDSFHSIHDPALKGTDATWPTAQFDEELYKTGAITLRDGTKKHGFKKLGYLLSPIAARPWVERRVKSNFENVPYNYYFVDCDAFGQVYDDYTPGRRVTQEEDAMARNDRMAWICQAHGAVIGSEGGSSYSAPVIHVAEGMLIPAFGWGDPDFKDKESEYFLGGYYPPEEPAIFFKSAGLKEKYRFFHYDPRFRLPLYEAVFHDSVVATNHWSYDNLKFHSVQALLFQTQLLYQVPPMYHLSADQFAKRKETMKAQYDVFSPLHRELGFSPMTGFDWLTPDRLVQRAVFGDRVEIVANFSGEECAYEKNSIPAGAVLVHWKDSGRVEVYRHFEPQMNTDKHR